MNVNWGGNDMAGWMGRVWKLLGFCSFRGQKTSGGREERIPFEEQGS
jgi:hypothetical protein